MLELALHFSEREVTLLNNVFLRNVVITVAC